MLDLDLTCGFRRQLENAILSWGRGEEWFMIDLLCRVQAESFAEGCEHTKEQLKEFLDTEGGSIGDDGYTEKK